MNFDLVTSPVVEVLACWAVSPLVDAMARLLFFDFILALIRSLLLYVGYLLHSNLYI